MNPSSWSERLGTIHDQDASDILQARIEAEEEAFIDAESPEDWEQ